MPVSQLTFIKQLKTEPATEKMKIINRTGNCMARCNQFILPLSFPQNY